MKLRKIQGGLIPQRPTKVMLFCRTEHGCIGSVGVLGANQNHVEFETPIYDGNGREISRTRVAATHWAYMPSKKDFEEAE